MRVEVIGRNHNVLSIKLHDPIDYKSFKENAYNGRYFGYLDVWLKGSRTDEQRKHYFALIEDIHRHTGERKALIIMRMKYLYMLENDLDQEPSMADNKMKKEDAAKLIQTIINFCIENDIPTRNNKAYMSEFDSKVLYTLTMKRKCWICEKFGDIAHVETVGMGRNRQKIDHTKHTFMCLCRQHHQEQHQIGINHFMDKYHIPGGINLSKESLKELGVMR